jgi:hypothetical protein
LVLLGAERVLQYRDDDDVVTTYVRVLAAVVPGAPADHASRVFVWNDVRAVNDRDSALSSLRHSEALCRLTDTDMTL